MHSPYGLEIVERCAGCRKCEPHAFCKLPESSLRALEALKYTTLYPRGALLFVEGQPGRGVYILCSGRVKLSAASSDARVIITRIARAGEGKNPFQLDSGDPKIPLQDYIYTETCYRMLQQSDPEVARFLLGRAHEAVNERWRQYKELAERT
jgi:hypothetical protein